jgi:hypothetical protein
MTKLLLSFIFLSFATVNIYAQQDASAFQVYKNESIGIQLKYLPGFTLQDESTKRDLLLKLKFKNLSEEYTIITVPFMGKDLKSAVQEVYNYYKKNDGESTALKNYKMLPLSETKSGFLFLEAFDLSGITYEALTIIKDVPTANSPGVMLRVQYEQKYAESISKVAAMLMATVHKL